jgi:hypothetical protein
VACTHHERNLEQTAELILILDARLRVYEATLVGNRTVGANKDVIGDGLAEYLHFEHISNDFFSLTIDVRMDECDIVIACDHVSEGGETLLDTLDRDSIGERVTEVLQLLVCCSRGDKEAMPIPYERAQLMIMA